MSATLTTTAGLDLGDLPGGVRVPDPADVAAYLRDHPGLAPLVPDLCRRVWAEVGPGAELTLTTYREPGDAVLKLLARLPAYDAQSGRRLDAVWDAWYAAFGAERIPGWVLLTTDFVKAGSDAAV
jgi:hypothetical protein